jgi:hypothetical protein
LFPNCTIVAASKRAIERRGNCKSNSAHAMVGSFHCSHAHR